MTRITKDQVVAAASTNRITKAATQDDVISVTGVDDIHATDIHDRRNTVRSGNCSWHSRRALNLINIVRFSGSALTNSHIIVVINVTGVTQYNIGINHTGDFNCRVSDIVNQAGTDGITLVTAQDNVIASQRQNHVSAAIGIPDCLYTTQGDRLVIKMCLCGRINGCRRNLAGITEDQVVTVARADRVVETTADDQIVAISCINRIGSTNINDGCRAVGIGNLGRHCSRADNHINIVRLDFRALANGHIIVIINVAGIADHYVAVI